MIYLSIAFIITTVVAFSVSVLAPSLVTPREKKRDVRN